MSPDFFPPSLFGLCAGDKHDFDLHSADIFPSF